MEKCKKRKHLKSESVSILRSVQLTLLLSLFFVVEFSASAYSQGTRIDLNVQNQSLSEVFERIRNKSEFTFVYDVQDVRPEKNISLSEKKATVEDILNNCLENTSLIYTVVDKTVIIKKSASKKIPIHKRQEKKKARIVTGKVTDEDGEPLPGVSVIIKGSGLGTSTDVDGNYSLNLFQNEVEIEYSFVGMIPQTIAYKEQVILNISLREDKQMLEEVVVVGYGNIAREKATGATTRVKATTLQNTQNVSYADALVGIVPGLYVKENFTNPDTPPQILLRGVGSINSGTEPLIVLDGIQMPAGFNSTTINSNDIKEMSILKDASATSIYGSRGSNGVIIITTKQGYDADKPNITFNIRHGIKTPDISFKDDMMSGSELLDYENSLGLYPQDNAEAQKLYKKRKALGNNVDWADLLLQNETSRQYDFSISGSNSKVNYYTSLAYSKVNNIFGSDYERFTAYVKVGYEIAKNLNFSLSGNFGSVSNKDRRTIGDPISNSFLLNPWEKVFDEDGDPLRKLAFSNNKGSGVSYNPLFIRDNKLAKSKRKNISGNATLIYKPKEWLTLKGVFGGFYDHDKSKDYEKTIIEGGQLTVNNSNADSYTGTLTAAVNKEFNNHSLNSVVGIEFNESDNYNLYGLASNFITDAAQILNAGKKHDKVSESSSSSGSEGYFARVNYSYDNTYNLSASFRRDGSSKFGKANKWANFYALGASVNLHKIITNEESFLSVLKLRGSYGTSGNDFIGDFDALSLYEFIQSYNGVDVATLSRGENPSLTWEKNKNTNVGLDIGAFNNKLYANIDYYIRDTYDLINDRPIPLQSGFNSLTSNIGNFRNKGVEILIQSTNFIRNNFTWTTNLNLSFNKSEVLDLTVDDELIQRGFVAYKKGMPVNALYLVEWGGVNSKTGYNQYVNPKATIEAKKLVDYITNTKETNRAEISSFRRVVDKTSTPKYFGGLTNTFSYNNFDASFLISFAGGHYAINSANYTIRNDVWLNQHKDVRNAWKKAGDKANLAVRALDFYRPIASRTESDYEISTQFLQDASYIKLKNINIGYTLNSKLTQRLGLDKVRVYVQAQNLFTLTDLDYIDPEYAWGGGVGLSSTSTRGFSFGLTVNF